MDIATNHLTREHNAGSLIKFSFPSIVSMLFMSVYEMIDGVFVANLINPDALSAINIVFPLISILIGISIMLATGGSAIVARKMGEGRVQEAKENFTLIVLVGIGFGVFCILIDLFLMKNLLNVLGATEKLFGYAYDYIFALALSSPLAILQMLFMTFFVTAGKPKLGMASVLMGGICNMILDYVFMGVFQWGIRGAAVATAIGYGIPALTGLLYFSLNQKGILKFARPKWDGKVLLRTCTNGLSEMVTNLATAVTTLMYNLIMLKVAGEHGVAAITIILYAQFLMNAVYMGYSGGVAPVISYNYGSDNKAQLKRVFKICIIFIGAVSVVTLAGAYLLADPIIYIFARPGSGVFEIAKPGFLIFAFSFLFVGVNIFASSMFTAFSNGIVSAVISLMRTFVILMACLLILPKILGLTGVWLAVPVSEVLTLFLSIGFILKYRKKYGY